MKKVLLSVAVVSLLGLAKSQAQVVTIQQVQTVSAADLSSCVDTSSYNRKRVKVRGVVVTSGELARQTSSGCNATNSRNIWIQDGKGAWRGLDIWGSCSKATSGIDLRNLQMGDSVTISGVIDEFSGETELVPDTVELHASGRPVHINLVNASDLNDNARANKLQTGEQWEGTFVELRDMSVVSVDPFSGNRVSFVVEDASGNKINVSDRFVAQKLPANGGTFVSPNVGDKFKFIRGVILHSKNGCQGTGRGYEIHPFDTSHYRYDVAAPSLSNINRTPALPKPADQVIVNVNANSAAGIKSVTLYYAVGVGNTNYLSVPMMGVGGVYAGIIPPQPEGSFVKYYVCAIDNSAQALRSCLSNVPGGSADPYFYTVRQNGLSIYDVQFTPFGNGNSGYVNQEVTVEGVVTASAEASNLGFIFIQQEGQTAWAGLMALGATQLSTLKVGEKVRVTGTIRESFGDTRIENVSSVTVIGTGSIKPVKLEPTVFTAYSFANNEAYENMLVTLAPTGSNKLTIVDENADAATGATTPNFAEYRVGYDENDPATGTRVIAGRVTSSAYSSLNFSYVNAEVWATQDGAMKVPVKVVKVGETMDSLSGIIYYGFSNMKIVPRNNADMYNYSDPVEDTSGSFINTKNAPAAGFTLYPNPAQDHLNIKLHASAKTTGTIHIMDLNGKVVARRELPLGSDVVNMPVDLKSGIYLVQIMAGANVSSVQKLIIK